MTQAISTQTAQHLTFKLGQEIFALDVAKVREILDVSKITRIPGSPDFMRGIINVRGSVVPVVDLRTRFGMSEAQGAVNNRIVVMEPTIAGKAVVFGALADSVYDVIELVPENIEQLPKIGTRWRAEYILGIGRQDEQFVILLDIDRVFSSDEWDRLEDTEGERPLSEMPHTASIH